MIVNNYTKTTHQKLHELYVLLNTERGTVPLKRDLGIDPNLVDKPITTIQSVITYELQNQIKKYIKGMELKSAKCYIENSKLIIECEVEINE